MKRFFCAAALAAFVMACGGGAADPAGICKKVGELAEAEGGEALEMYNKRLKDDCVEELTKEKEKLGEGWGKFAECVNGAKDFSSVYKDCNPKKFRAEKKEEKKDDGE